MNTKRPHGVGPYDLWLMTRSPLRLLFITVAFVFLGQFLINVWLPVLSPIAPMLVAVLESVLLVLILFPALYFLLFYPLALHMKKQREAEQALQDSEQRNRMLLASLPQRIFFKDADSVFVSVNDPFALDLEVKPEKIVGRTDFDFSPRELAEKYRADDRRVMATGQPETLVERNVVGDQERIVEVVKAPVLDDSAEVIGLLGIFTDITERVRAEEALRRQESERAAILNSMSELMLYQDTNGRILWANRAAADSVGLTTEELIGKRCYEVWHARSERCVGCPVAEALETGQPQTRQMTSPDGRAWRVRGAPVRDDEGNIVGAVEVTLDITERKRAEEALRTSEEQYRTTLDAMADAIHAVDRDLQIVLVNRALQQWCHELGLDRDIVGRSVFEAFPFLPDSVGEEYRRAFELGEVVRTEDRNTVGDSQFLTETRKIPVFEGDTVVRVITVIRDITEHRRSEEQLAYERGLLNVLMEHTPDHIYFKDEDCRFIRTSQALTDWFGLSDPQETIGKTDFDFFSEEHARQAYEDEKAVMRTGRPIVAKVEKETWPDGTQTWVSTTKAALRDPEGNVVGTFGISRDIAEQQQAAMTLRENEEAERRLAAQLKGLNEIGNELSKIDSLDELSRLAVELGRDRLGFERLGLWLVDEQDSNFAWGTWGVDEKGDLRDERSVKLPVHDSPAIESVVLQRRSLAVLEDVELRDGRGKAVGKGTNAIAPLWDGEEVIGYLAVDNLLHGGPITERDQELLTVYAATLGHLCTRKRAEQALRESEERFRLLVDTAFDGINICEAEAETGKRRLLLCNDRFVEMSGYTRPELEDAADLDALTVSDMTPEQEREISRAMEKERPYRGTASWIRPDGKENVYEFSAVAMERDGRYYLMGVDRDITDRILAERRLAEYAGQLKALNAELQRSNRDLQDFTYTVSHDLQEPLRKVHSFGQFLVEDCGDQLPEVGREHLRHMQNAAVRMKEFIQHLLALARVGTHGADPEPVDPGRIVGVALETLSDRIRECGGQVTVQASLPTVMADPVQLGQVFQNLIGNALKFRKPDRAPRIAIGARIEDDQAVFNVTDNGVGIEERYLEKIFGIFQRLHARDIYAGAGVGLALCEKIVRRHGGIIWAESEPGEGSVFRFTLSLATQPEEEQA